MRHAIVNFWKIEFSKLFKSNASEKDQVSLNCFGSKVTFVSMCFHTLLKLLMSKPFTWRWITKVGNWKAIFRLLKIMGFLMCLEDFVVVVDALKEEALKCKASIMIYVCFNSYNSSNNRRQFRSDKRIKKRCVGKHIGDGFSVRLILFTSAASMKCARKLQYIFVGWKKVC